MDSPILNQVHIPFADEANYLDVILYKKHLKRVIHRKRHCLWAWQWNEVCTSSKIVSLAVLHLRQYWLVRLLLKSGISTQSYWIPNMRAWWWREPFAPPPSQLWSSYSTWSEWRDTLFHMALNEPDMLRFMPEPLHADLEANDTVSMQSDLPTIKTYTEWPYRIVLPRREHSIIQSLKGTTDFT